MSFGIFVAQIYVTGFLLCFFIYYGDEGELASSVFRALRWPLLILIGLSFLLMRLLTYYWKMNRKAAVATALCLVLLVGVLLGIAESLPLILLQIFFFLFGLVILCLVAVLFYFIWDAFFDRQ